MFEVKWAVIRVRGKLFRGQALYEKSSEYTSDEVEAPSKLLKLLVWNIPYMSGV